MGDSQNWSSFEEPAAPTKKAVVPPKPLRKEGASDGGSGGSGAKGGLLSASNVRILQQRVMFGAIVGFCTGATFGTSTSPTIAMLRALPVARYQAD